MNIEYIVKFLINPIERFYKNHLKSQTHTNNKHKRKSFQINLLN